MDINACPAWEISQGAGIKVAILDKGINIYSNDLIPNLYPVMYDAEMNLARNVFSCSDRNDEHGTEIAGIIGAANNNFKMVGVAPQCILMPVYANSEWEDVRGINWAWHNGADVINCSWRLPFKNDMLDEAIDSALIRGRNGKGCVVVFASGNEGVLDVVDYPANSNPDILAVGSVNWDGWRSDFSHYGTALDMVAPGNHILTTHSWPNTDMLWEISGTSYAAPHVAGVAALILSVNPNLTGQQVRNIIESTAQKIRTDYNTYSIFPDRLNGTWNEQVGYGLVDAYAAVLAAQATFSDLMIRDDLQDTGIEPNPVSVQWNASPDIWLQDAYFTRRLSSAELVPNMSCNVCYKITNRGTSASSGNARLRLYWTKSTSNPKWSSSWWGTETAGNTGVPLGGLITPVSGIAIGALAAGSSYVNCYPWTVPAHERNLAPSIMKIVGGGSNNANWGYMFLAAIDDGNPFQHLNETDYSSALFAQENNSVAVDNGDLLVSGQYYHPIFYIPANWDSNSLTFGRRMTVSIGQILVNGQYYLRNFAELYITLSDDLMGKLIQQGNDGIKIIDANTVLLTSASAQLHFNPLDNREGLYFIGAKVHFISDKMPELNNFNFDFTLAIDGETPETMRFTAVRDENVYFKAFAEASRKKVVRAKELVTLTSNQIFDDAKYTWYNEAGEKIGENSLTVTPELSQKYKVEILKEEDGFKSYDEVEVVVVDGLIESLSPNPAQSYVRVDYKLSDNAANAFVQISDLQNLVSVSYPLSTNGTQQEISLSGFVPGTYFVKLIISGVVADTKSLIIY
ncbi:hypothetical protein FACS1894180_2430 [Bacteroidia bacterium]|nr:hypothetical protein FACS1894180_2430 [Bacteroidia bacterium]